MADPVHWLTDRLSGQAGLPAWGQIGLSFGGLPPSSGSCDSVWVTLAGPHTRVETVAGAEPVRCRLQIDWSDFERYVAGERILLDLLSTGRLKLSGHRALGLSLLLLLKTGAAGGSLPTAWQILGQDALTPYPAVQVRCDFQVEPAVPRDPATIPVVINSFNRPTPLARLVEALRRRNCRNLYVIDNHSACGKLREYYRREKLRVYFLDRNVGAYAIWRTPIERDFVHGYYVYTDSDIVPIEECPDNFLGHFQQLLVEHRDWDKVGFGLKIDDLPDSFAHKQRVIQHETAFWRRPVGDEVYLAPIDTTFALYRPGARGGTLLTAARTGGRYVARHLPWYTDSANPSPEERFYLEQIAGYAHWSNLDKRQASPSGMAASDPTSVTGVP